MLSSFFWDHGPRFGSGEIQLAIAEKLQLRTAGRENSLVTLQEYQALWVAGSGEAMVLLSSNGWLIGLATKVP